MSGIHFYSPLENWEVYGAPLMSAIYVSSYLIPDIYFKHNGFLYKCFHFVTGQTNSVLPNTVGYGKEL